LKWNLKYAMGPLNMINARRVMPVAVFKWQILVILVSVAISGWLVLYLFDVNLTTKLVRNLIIFVFIIHDAIYILYVIRCRWLIETSVHRSQVRESTVIFRFNCTSNHLKKSVLFTIHTPLTYAISVGVRTVKRNRRSLVKVDKMRDRQNELYLLEITSHGWYLIVLNEESFALLYWAKYENAVTIRSKHSNWSFKYTESFSVAK
jgi:hypothetical protein